MVLKCNSTLWWFLQANASAFQLNSKEPLPHWLWDCSGLKTTGNKPNEFVLSTRDDFVRLESTLLAVRGLQILTDDLWIPKVRSDLEVEESWRANLLCSQQLSFLQSSGSKDIYDKDWQVPENLWSFEIIF